MPADRNDEGVVRVTLNTVFQAQLQHGIDLAEIKGTLLLLTHNMTQVAESQKDHETRLRSLEKNEHVESRLDSLERNSITVTGVYAALGAMGTLAVIVGTVLGLLIK